VAAALTGGAGASAASPAGTRGLRAILSEVSCQGRSFCLAIGSYSEPGHPGVRLIDEWNGKTWSTAADPLTGDLSSLTCGSLSLCFATRSRIIGRKKKSTVTDTVKWNGRTWRTITNQPAGGVSCVSATVCMTLAGIYIDNWNGSSWQNTGVNCGWGPDCGWNGFSCSGSGCSASFYFCDDDDCARAVYAPADLSRVDAIADVFDRAQEALGPVTALVVVHNYESEPGGGQQGSD
jgi:hypothetical protein